jgi:CubicO group peptidase (beta-lactamase class C family)
MNVAPDGTTWVFTDPDRRLKLAKAFPEIDALGAKTIAKHGIPGMAIGVVIDGELAYERGFGFADLERRVPVTADTVFRIGSMTKTFTALAILALRDDGVLRLDDPLVLHLPEAAGLVYPTRDAGPVTLRQMLTHTSGLPRDVVDTTTPAVPATEQAMVAALAGLPLDDAPGTRRGYSTYAMGLLGLVVARRSGKSYRAFVEERILRPLGMDASTWDPEPIPAAHRATPYQRGPSGEPAATPDWRWGDMVPGGGMWSSTRDLARYAAMNLDAYPPGDRPEKGPLARGTLRESHSGAATAFLNASARLARPGEGTEPGDIHLQAKASTNGFGWYLDETCEFDRIVQHGGGSAGFTAQLTMLPEHGVAVIVLRNHLNAAVPWPERTASDVIAALEKTGGLAKRVRQATPDPAFEKIAPALLALIGEWSDAGYERLLTRRRHIHLDAVAERARFAAARADHGSCTKIERKSASSPFDATFDVTCERGQLTLIVSVNPVDRGISRHIHLRSRAIEAPARFASLGSDVASLITKWDDAAYKRVAAHDTSTKDEMQKWLGRMREAHGACRVKNYWRNHHAEDDATGIGDRNDRQGFWMTCERGGGIDMPLSVNAARPDHVVSFALKEELGPKSCSVR